MKLINILQVIMDYPVKNKISNKAKLIVLAGIVMFMLSCKDEYFYYDTSNAVVQFGPEQDRLYNSSYNLADTTKSFTFVYESSSVTRDTVFFDLYALGGPKDFDRPINLKQLIISDTLNAEPGVHYIAFDDPSVSGLYVIKAGEVHLSVPVIIVRDESLQNSTYALKLAIESNEYFETGDPDLLWRVLYFTDQVSKPSKWTTTVEKYYFGKYSQVKHRFMIKESGEKWDDDFLTVLMADYGYLQFWKTKVQTYLTAYNNAHPDAPLRDEDGDLVIFP